MFWIIGIVVLGVMGVVAFFLGAIAIYSIFTSPVSLGMVIAGGVAVYFIHTKYRKGK